MFFCFVFLIWIAAVFTFSDIIYCKISVVVHGSIYFHEVLFYQLIC